MTTVSPVPHGDHRCYWRGCRRPECTTAASARARLSRYLRQTGRGDLCPPNRAAAHIQRLREAGMADKDIQGSARIGLDVFHRIVTRSSDIRRSTERRVLAVEVRETDVHANCSMTDATGSCRRLQALTRLGWPNAVMACRMGIVETTVRQIIDGHRNVVTLRTAAQITGFYQLVCHHGAERYGVTPLSAKRARNLAERHGRHPAAVWDDLDNPHEEPKYGERVSRVAAIVEDTAELVREGLSSEGVAMRLGIEWESVRRAHLRAGVLVPEVAA